MVKKQFSLLILIIVLGLPAIHKITGDIPPEWFAIKFGDSLIGRFPGGVMTTYLIIMVLELMGSLLLLIGGIKMIINKDYNRWISRGFSVYYAVFSILTFGSFLVEDYDNGFKDFLYFVGVLIIDQVFYKSDKESFLDK